MNGAQVLAFKHERRIEAFVSTRIGSKGPLVVEEIAERTICDAIKSAVKFEGRTIEEFRAWIFRIARRRIADYLRKGRVEEEPFEVETREGEVGERQFTGGDPFAALDDASVFQQTIDGLSEPHRMVVVLTRFRDLPHKEVAELVNRHYGDRLNDPMTEQNVNKINSRFDKRLDELLDEAEVPPSADLGDD